MSVVLNFTLNLTAVIVIQNLCEERFVLRAESRTFFIGKSGQFGGFVADFAQTAATFLHVAELREHIGQNRIAASGWHLVQIAVLYQTAVKHAAWRVDDQPVVVNVDVHLATQFGIVAVDECIHQCLEQGAVGVVGRVQTAVGQLYPAFLVVQSHKLHTCIQQREQIALILTRIEGVVFLQTVPTGAIEAGMPVRTLVGKQHASLCEQTVIGH